MDGCWVTKTVEFNHLASFVNSVFTAFRFQNSDDWWQFHSQQFFSPTSLHLQLISPLVQWSQLVQRSMLLVPNDVTVIYPQFLLLAHAEAELFERSFFLFVNKVSVVRFEFNKLIVNFFIDDDRLFRRTDHTVVKWFGHDDIVLTADVGWFFNVSEERFRHKSWFPTRIAAFTMALPPVAGSSQLLHSS